MFLSAFVCLLAGLHKTTQTIFRKFGGKKRRLDFRGNPDMDADPGFLTEFLPPCS